MASPAAAGAPTPGEVVVLDFSALRDGADLSQKIAQAFGHEGLGLLLVRGVPELPRLRQDLLPLANRLAGLPASELARLEHAESSYSFGWSHGKEKLQGVPDLAKGSFYANPQFDEPETDRAVVAKYSSFVHPNIWPHEALPELEHAFKALGQTIVSVGQLVARQCDAYVRQQIAARFPHDEEGRAAAAAALAASHGYGEHKLEHIIRDSRCCKARLLHYFARSQAEIDAASSDHDLDFSSWCGWHNDHGSLTGLVSAMFIESATGAAVTCPDPNAGLYIRDRHGNLVKANIPPDHIAYQIGETAQIHSGGILQATPHAVRGAHTPGVSRETFAVFMEPMFYYPMNVPAGTTPSEAQTQESAAMLPRGVPPIASRWDNDMDFNQFTHRTLGSYY